MGALSDCQKTMVAFTASPDFQKYVKTYIALYFRDLNQKIFPNCDIKNYPSLEICTQNKFVWFVIF